MSIRDNTWTSSSIIPGIHIAHTHETPLLILLCSSSCCHLTYAEFSFYTMFKFFLFLAFESCSSFRLSFFFKFVLRCIFLYLLSSHFKIHFALIKDSFKSLCHFQSDLMLPFLYIVYYLKENCHSFKFKVLS